MLKIYITNFLNFCNKYILYILFLKPLFLKEYYLKSLNDNFFNFILLLSLLVKFQLNLYLIIYFNI